MSTLRDCPNRGSGHRPIDKLSCSRAAGRRRPDPAGREAETEARERRLRGEGPEFAARQASLLFALAGLLAFAGIGSQPERWRDLAIIGSADLGVAAVVWWLPWHRWGRYRPLLLTVPAFVILAFSTWAFGGFAAGTGPFFVLVFAWAGLHFPVRSLLAMVPGAAIAYITPLVATHQSREVVSSAVVLVPVAVGIGSTIAVQVAHLRQAHEQIHQAERWRAALTATLAHDVRSPLSAVRMALHLLGQPEDRMPEESRRGLLATAQQQTARIQRLAEGLLDMDRVDIRGGLRLDLREVALRHAVREAVGYLDAAEVVIDIAPDIAVRADPHRLEQIIINLTTNALSHGRPPVVIGAAGVAAGAGTAAGTAAGEMVRLVVRDHGDGVPQERLADLFGRFSGTDTGKVGLGLWIVRELVRAHGGEVSYQPADPGACFVVTLPAADARVADAAGADERPAGQSQLRERFLS